MFAMPDMQIAFFQKVISDITILSLFIMYLFQTNTKGNSVVDKVCGNMFLANVYLG